MSSDVAIPEDVLGGLPGPRISGALLGVSGVMTTASENWKSVIFGVLVVLAGIGVMAAGVNANVGSDVDKQNYILGGVFAFILGLGILLARTGAFSVLKDYFSSTEKMKAGVTVFVVLATTIGIFVALFYNYATGETLSFATALLIIIFVVVIFAALFFFSGKIPIANLISRSLLILFYFMPYAFFTFGILVDILTRQIQFTGASFTGFTAVLFNYAFSLVANDGVVPEVEKPLCEIPGLSFLTSTIMPQSMVSVLSTLAYIATFISRTPTAGGSTAVNAAYIWPSWALFFGIAGLQSVMLASTGCLKTPEGTPLQNSGPVKALKAFLFSLAYGGSIGALAYEFLGKRAGTADAVAAGGSPVLGSTSGSTTPTVGTCAAGSSDGEFICESFENGKLKRTVMTE